MTSRNAFLRITLRNYEILVRKTWVNFIVNQICLAAWIRLTKTLQYYQQESKSNRKYKVAT